MGFHPGLGECLPYEVNPIHLHVSYSLNSLKGVAHASPNTPPPSNKVSMIVWRGYLDSFVMQGGCFAWLCRLSAAAGSPQGLSGQA